MADQVQFRLNIPDFRKQLSELGSRMQRKIATDAVRSAGTVFWATARQMAPVLRKKDSRRIKGVLKGSLVIAKSKINSRRGVVAYYVGVRAGKKAKSYGIDPFYWRFLEAGWVPRAAGSGRRKRRERITTGRIKSYQFLDPAFKRERSRALAAFVKSMEKGIAKAQREIR